jgi:hypothetical protein
MSTDCVGAACVAEESEVAKEDLEETEGERRRVGGGTCQVACCRNNTMLRHVPEEPVRGPRIPFFCWQKAAGTLP